MKLLDILTDAWAIVPDKLAEIQAIYATHMRGEKIDLKAVEARIGKPMENAEQRYEVIDGVAVIPLAGVLAKKMNLFSSISGGASYQLFERDLMEAVSRPSVQAILVEIDSPGGSVDGVMQAASAIRAARQSKPVFALADGMMASAAYWIGSAAEQVMISDGTTTVGSIGVVARHVDQSRQDEARGLKVTEIYAGKYKRIASEHAPLTEEGRESIQERVDYLYSLFVQDVASNRGVSVEQVIKDMADGRTFVGQQAIAAGLVDGVSTRSAMIAALKQRAGGASANIHNRSTAMQITLDQIKADAPEVLQAYRAEIADELRAEGAQAERERIQAVEGQTLPGHEALIASLKYDGKTTGPEAAVQILQAEKSKLGTVAKALADAAPDILPPSASETGEQEQVSADYKAPAGFAYDKGRAALLQRAKAYAADHKCSLEAAINAISKE